MSNCQYRITDLISLEACTGCRQCVDNCPAVSVDNDGQLSGLYRMHILKKLVRSRSWIAKVWPNWKKEINGQALIEFSNTVFKCTLCGNCQEVCPVGISLKDIWVSLRQDLVESKVYPKKNDMIQSNLDESHNVFDEDNEERADWVEDMPDAPDHGFQKDTARVVYFTGCVSSYFPMAQKIPMALARIFEQANVDFTVLGEDEWCCGFPLLGAGLGKDAFKSFVDHNIEAVRQTGATKVVFSCPSCYEMWKEHYPPEFEFIHATQFVNQLIQDGRLCLDTESRIVTYHDPCDLGRGCRVFDAPRKIIDSLPGVTLVELPNNRENCRCCGGGGNLEMIDNELSGSIAGQKINEILSTGAQTVVTSCQQCVRTMNTYVKRNKIDLEVMDITQLVESCLTKKR